MFQSQSQVPLQSPPERLEAPADFLRPAGLVDWLMSPWLSERTRCLILPLQMDGHRLLLCWDGLATVRLPGDGSFRLQGRTGAFGSVLAVNRSGPVTTIKGFLDDQTVEYTVDEGEPGEWRVEGDTGRFRSRYVVKAQEGEVFLAGDHGQFDSNFTARFPAEGAIHLEGVRDGEKIDLRLQQDGTSLAFEGAFLGAHSEFVLSMEEREWAVGGHVAGDRVTLGLKLAEDGVEIAGHVPKAFVNFKLFRTEEGYWVRGKAGNYHLNYRLILQQDA